MTEKLEFEKRKMYIFSNYIYWLMITNIMFMLAIIPTLVIIIFIEPAIVNILLYMIAFLPAGPALGALVACMIQVVEKKDLNPAKDYWIYYIKNWKDSLLLWSVFLVAAMVLLVDIFYVNNVFSFGTFFFSAAFQILFALIIVFMIPTFIIMVKFKFSLKDLLKLGIIYTVSHFKITTGNACIVFLTIFAMYLTIDFFPILAASLLVLMLVNYNYEILKDIQKKYIKQ